MTRTITCAAAILLMAFSANANAQTAGLASKSTSDAPAGTTSKASAPQGSAPAPTTTPGNQKPQNTVGGAGVGAIVDGKQRVCVIEPKATTKTVHGSVCREYCSPRCSVFKSLMSRFRGSDDSCGGCGDCCELLHRRVLTKKTVPDCDTKTCVLKEIPGCDLLIPAPATVLPSGPLKSSEPPNR
jgi:hypothetical protein